jgi:hypothetical protein
MTPIEMHYSWIGFVYQATAWLGVRLAEKLFDIGLVALGTWYGYRLAKQHLEHFVSDIVGKMDAKYLNLIGTMDAKYLNLIQTMDAKYLNLIETMDAKYLNLIQTMDAKYLNLNRQVAFHRAVNAMLPELPGFYLRPAQTFSPEVAGALAEFTSWSTAIDATHTDKKSLELVGKEAYTLAEKLVEQDMGFKEEESVPNYDWIIEIGPLPIGWTVEETPDLTIYNWDTGIAVYRHALMKETARTPTSIRYSWTWDMLEVPCGLYVGVVNFTLGGSVKIQETASVLQNRVRIFFIRENRNLVKTHKNVPWDDKPADNPRC